MPSYIKQQGNYNIFFFNEYMFLYSQLKFEYVANESKYVFNTV